MRLLALLALLPSLALAERLPEIALKDASGQAVKLPGDRPTVLVLGSFS
jgi:hypothetical protein